MAVLVRQQFMSLQHFAGHLSSYVDVTRESALLMVQIMNCLKTLHTQGSEQVYLSQFVLSRENPQMSPKVCLLPQPSAKVSRRIFLFVFTYSKRVDLMTQLFFCCVVIKYEGCQDRHTHAAGSTCFFTQHSHVTSIFNPLCPWYI